MEKQPETEYMAMWSIILGLPLLFAMFVSFRISGLEGRTVSFLGDIGFVALLFPWPMTIGAYFILLLSVAVCVSSAVGLVRLPRNRTWREPRKAAFFFSIELILLMLAVMAYFANILGFSLRSLLDHFALSIVVTIVGVPFGVVGIILLMDALFSRLWHALLGYAPGIFKGQTYRNLKKALKGKDFRRDISFRMVAGLIAIPLVLLVLFILMSLGML